MNTLASVRWSRCLAVGVAALLVVTGLVVLVGWYTRSLALVQLHPRLSPMQPNTVLCFLVSGVGLLASSRQPVLPIICGGAVVLIGALTIAEYAAGITLRLDTLLLVPWATVGPSQMGRMAPTAALAFVLGGGALVMFDARLPFRWSTPIAATLGTFIMALAIIALLVHACSVKVAYHWGDPTVALHTAVGFLVLGGGIVAHAWSLGTTEPYMVPDWLPLLAGGGALTVSLGFYRAVTDLDVTAQAHSLLPSMTLGAGLMLTVLLTGSLALAQTARRRAHEVERINRELAQLEQELRRQHDLYEMLLQGLSDLGEGVLVGEESRFIFVNDFFCRLSGYSRDELLALVPTALAPPNNSAAAAERLQRLRNGESVGPFEGALQRKDGRIVPLEVTSKVLRTGEQPQYISLIRDISTRKQAGAALRASEARLAGILDTADDAIITVNERQQITLFNQGAERIFGYAAQDVIGKSLDFLIPARFIAAHRAHIGQFARSPDVARKMAERRAVCGRRADGTEFPAEATISKLIGDDDTIFTVMLRDVTDRVQSEAALRESERRFRAIFDSMFQFIGLLTPDGTVLEINQASLDFGGVDRAEVIGRPCWETYWWRSVPEAQRRLRSAIVEAAAGRFVRYEIDVLGPGGQIATVDFSLKPLLDQHGQVIMLIPEGRDVTEHKQAAVRLQVSLHEKEILLQEIHHRVKNNLQIIVSLLRLQSYTISDPALRDLLRDSQNRVHAMALVHEQLYRAHDLAHVDFDAYIRSLAVSVLRSYETHAAGTTLVFAMDERVELAIDAAIPLGLIVTELISNSAKHAFPDGRRGSITVGLQTDPDGLLLTVRDDGIGLPVHIHLQTTESLGLQLVSDLAAQLDGSVTVERGGGTAFQLYVPNVISKERQ